MYCLVGSVQLGDGLCELSGKAGRCHVRPFVLSCPCFLFHNLPCLFPPLSPLRPPPAVSAQLYKPLEAVFKFMVKKWSGVAYSDLNSIRIVLDVDKTDKIGSGNAETRQSTHRTIVWSAEHSSKPIKDLMRSLPDPVLDHICNEEALNLTYTFLTGPVGPPPSQGSLPWDMPQQPPATAAPGPPPPSTEHQPIPRLGGMSVSSFPLHSPAVASAGQTAAGAGMVFPWATGSAQASSVAMAIAQGMVPPALATRGLEGARNGNQSASGVTAAAGAGGWPIAWKRRVVRGGGSPADIITNAALKRHYTIVKAMFKRQGINSPPVTHFLPGGLFARMHTAHIAGGIGPAVGPCVGTTPGLTALPQYSSQPRVKTSYTTAGTEAQGQQKDGPIAAEEPLESSEGVVDVGGDGGYEDFESEETTEAREGGGDETGGALMGEETCMALFSGNGVELLVDPSPPPTENGQGKGQHIDVGDTAPAVQPLLSPLDGSRAALAPAPPGSPAGAHAAVDASVDPYQPPKQRAACSPGTHEVAASSTPPVASGAGKANVDLLLPPTQPASPPQEGCALMGEDTCMALFSGGDGIGLLADASLSPPETGEAAAVVGEGGEENRIDSRVAEPAVEPVSSLPTGGKAASASAAQHAGKEPVGEQVEPMLTPSQSDEQPETAPHTGGVAVVDGSTTQPTLTSTCDVRVAAVEAVGAVGAEGNAEKGGVTLQLGTDTVPAVRVEGAARVDVGAERPTTQPATEAATVPEEMLPASPCSRLAEAHAETNSRRTGSAAAGPSAMPTRGGERAVSEALEDMAKVAPTASGGRSGDEPPLGEHDPGSEKAMVPAAVARPAVEEGMQTFSPAPGEPAQAEPQPPSSRLSPPIFKLGSLPSRAKSGHPPSPTGSVAKFTPSVATAEKGLVKPGSAEPSKTAKAQSPPRPPSGEGQVGPPPLSNGGASRPGRASSLTGGQQQRHSELEPVAPVSGVSTESCRPAGPQARDHDSEAQV